MYSVVSGSSTPSSRIRFGLRIGTCSDPSKYEQGEYKWG